MSDNESRRWMMAFAAIGLVDIVSLLIKIAKSPNFPNDGVDWFGVFGLGGAAIICWILVYRISKQPSSDEGNDR